MSAEILKDYPTQIELPIQWGDMDAFQHVNNLVYLRHFESARIAYLMKCNYQEFMESENIGPILRDTSCRYRIPLTFPDTIIAATRVTEIGEDRFKMHHIVYSLEHQAVAAEGDGTIVCVNYAENCKAQIPASLRERILAMETVAPATLT